MTVNEYLDAAKARLKLQSDAALARHMGVSHVAIPNMRHSGSISDDTADKLSAILELEPAVVLLNARAAKSHNRRVVASVRRLLQQAGLVGIVFAVVVETGKCILCQIAFVSFSRQLVAR